MSGKDPFAEWGRDGGTSRDMRGERHSSADERELTGHHHPTPHHDEHEAKADFEQVAGFLDTPTQPGSTAKTASVNLEAAPQRDFWAQRLVLISATNQLASWNIIQLQVGTAGQFVTNSGYVPAAVFAFNAVGVRMKFNKSRPGVDIQLSMALSVTITVTDYVYAAAIGPAAAQGH